jgi:hypothetical protein
VPPPTWGSGIRHGESREGYGGRSAHRINGYTARWFILAVAGLVIAMTWMG